MVGRANIIFNTTGIHPTTTLAWALDGSIVLYSHHGGIRLGADLARALRAARMRWHDPAYGTRIIVSQVIGSRWSQELDYGLYVDELGDNDHNLLVVDFARQQIVVYPDDNTSLQLRHASFDTFAALTDESAMAFHNDK